MMNGKTINTRIPKRMTSKTSKYMVHKIPKVSHQIRGAERRHVFTDVYSKICAVKNHVRVNKDKKRDNLAPSQLRLQMKCRVTDRA